MRAREATARRYARAVYELARDSGAADAVGRELAQVVDVLTRPTAVTDVLTRPWIKPEDRRAIAAAIAQKAGARQLVRDFVGLVAERGRADHLAEIVAAYQVLVFETAG